MAPTAPLLPLLPTEPCQSCASEREDQSVSTPWLRQEVLFIQPPAAAHDHPFRSDPGWGWQCGAQGRGLGSQAGVGGLKPRGALGSQA